MLIVSGQAALTSFQLERLLEKSQSLLPNIQAIQATYIYCIQLSSNLDANQLALLHTLLSIPHKTSQLVDSSAMWVLPRVGTLSSWCSKAVDIAHRCGLTTITRIERGVCYQLANTDMTAISAIDRQQLTAMFADKMTESVFFNMDDLSTLFQKTKHHELQTIDLLALGIDALQEANVSMGLALSTSEITHLYQAFVKLKRNPTDAELMMLAQVNSEHCRHKIFNARWFIDNKEQTHSLFAMIRHTYAENPAGVLTAYSDNSAVLQGELAEWFFPNTDLQYSLVKEPAHIVLKVETHNHPCAISPFPGAATGSGGEIRDEAATGIGARPSAGLCGFAVSHLHIPGYTHSWEQAMSKPAHVASALEIMLQAPIGAASFNNEFGRPNILGYFRTFGMYLGKDKATSFRGYHKPIMLAGGIGIIRESQVKKKSIPVGSLLAVLGGPALAIGLGGGSASSKSTGESANQALDFASVQRSNPEMQRRVQELINRCWEQAELNPILNIHDVGAGGLSNALPELIEASGAGGIIDLNAIFCADHSLSPMEIWCNEAQERFVLAIDASRLTDFLQLAERERCPVSVVGKITAESCLRLTDAANEQTIIDMPMSLLFKDMPKLEYHAKKYVALPAQLNFESVVLAQAIERVLQFPVVADKSFLITIGDRSVGGLVTQDQMVGPWQVPVADVGVTCADFIGYKGAAMALGERAPIALLHPAAAARMAVGESITNIAAARIGAIENISLSANWMAAAHESADGAGLYEAVKAIGLELCPALGMAIPVGKDSLSMRMNWQQDGRQYNVSAPISAVITAAAPVKDVRLTLTPQLQLPEEATELLLIDLGEGCCAMGGSVLAQVYNQLGQMPPDVDNPQLLAHFFAAIQELNDAGLLLAYHDRSDGGLLATVCEMAFAGHCGIDVCLDSLASSILSALFNEELGAVVQIKTANRPAINQIFMRHHLLNCVHSIGCVNSTDQINFSYQGKVIYSQSRVQLHCLWSQTSYHMQLLRDNPACVQQEHARLTAKLPYGLTPKLTFDLSVIKTEAPAVCLTKPKVAILREQGINGHLEMAAVFSQVGFTAVDVPMSDLLAGRQTLESCVGLAVCGGFSFGDVLGAGRGFAQSILCCPALRDQFSNFFERKETFSLGVCNGCQVLSQLKALIPGAAHWPDFTLNASHQFEARLVQVCIESSPSIFIQGMEGSVLPVVVSHGEGRVVQCDKSAVVSMRYVNAQHEIATAYPDNPNGSVAGVAGLCSVDGRVSILMPHPERVFRGVQFSWCPPAWKELSPWLKFFQNARDWVG